MSTWACDLCAYPKSDPGDDYCGWCQEVLTVMDEQISQ